MANAKTNRLIMSYSSDRGKTWTEPRVILPGKQGIGVQFNPMPAVNKDGTLAVCYDDTNESPADKAGTIVNRYVAVSLDGGEHFRQPAKISSAPTQLDKVENAALWPSIQNDGDPKWIGAVTLANEASPFAGEYVGFTAAADGTFHSFSPDGRSGTFEIWSVAVRVERGAPAPLPTLARADVTNDLKALLEPSRSLAENGTVEVPIRFRNTSNRPIYGPLEVEVERIEPNGTEPILNSANGKKGIGASVDYSRALGDFPALEPGATTEGIVWRFKRPSLASEFPKVKLKITARVEQK
jgi:hypothetical protein